MEKKNKIYVAYGSNMNIHRMAKSCPFAKVLGVGELENYKLTFRGRRRGVANIEKCEGQKIPVVLWELNETWGSVLEKSASMSRKYVKIQVQVKFKSKTIDAAVYVIADKYCEFSAKPRLSYIETMVQGYDEYGIIKDGIFNAVQDVYKELAIKRIV